MKNLILILLILFVSSEEGYTQCTEAQCNPGVEYPYYPGSIDDHVYILLDSMSGINCPDYSTLCTSCIPAQSEDQSGCEFQMTVYVGFNDLCQLIPLTTHWGVILRPIDPIYEGLHDCLPVGSGACSYDLEVIGNEYPVLGTSRGFDFVLTNKLCCGKFNRIRMDLVQSNGYYVDYCYQSQGEYGVFVFTCTNCDGQEIQIPE